MQQFKTWLPSLAAVMFVIGWTLLTTSIDTRATMYKWSQTAATNATADSTINWAEGQPPSSVNDSARGMMAAIAKYRDDESGSAATAGGTTAYTLTTSQGFTSLALMDKAKICFVMNATNAATVMLAVDGLTAKPLRSAPSTEIGAGTLVSGSPYCAVYNNSNGEFYLEAFYGGLQTTVPLGTVLDYAGSTAPSSYFALSQGQCISSTTYAALSTLFGATSYGSCSAGNFALPDLRGRIVAGKDDMGGSAANRITNAGSGITGTTLGATGGAETVTLVTGNLPPYTPSGTVGAPTITGPTRSSNLAAGGQVAFVRSSDSGGSDSSSITASAPTFTGTAQGGTSTAVNKMGPTMILSKIIRIQ